MCRLVLLNAHLAAPLPIPLPLPADTLDPPSPRNLSLPGCCSSFPLSSTSPSFFPRLFPPFVLVVSTSLLLLPSFFLAAPISLSAVPPPPQHTRESTGCVEATQSVPKCLNWVASSSTLCCRQYDETLSFTTLTRSNISPNVRNKLSISLSVLVQMEFNFCSPESELTDTQRLLRALLTTNAIGN